MNSYLKEAITKQRLMRALPIIIGLIGLIFYLFRSWNFAIHLTSTIWDEGMYLLKGLIFANGEYHPFEDYGPWTNQMPLAFLIPGYVQKIFGPGILSGRIYAVIIGLLSLTGLWAAVRRIAGNWWAAAVVWAFSINMGWVSVFSIVSSQALVYCFFSWMLFFLAGKNKKTYEILIAVFLAACAGLVRINVFPILALLIIYIYFLYDRKLAFQSLLVGIFPILFFQLIYWPESLKIWAYWIPNKLAPWIENFRSPWREVFLPDGFSWFKISDWLHNPEHLAWHGVDQFLGAIKAHLLPIIAFLLSLVFWPKREKWKSDNQWKFGIFLLVSFIVMFSVHIWAAMGGKTCKFSCIVMYLFFVDIFGLTLLPLVFSQNQVKITKQKLLFLIPVFSMFFFIFNYGELLDFSPLAESFLGTQIHLFGKTISPQALIVVIFKIPWGIIDKFVLYDSNFKLITNIILSILIVFIIPLILYVLLKYSKYKRAFPAVYFSIFLVSLIILSNSRNYSFFLLFPTCESNVIEDYEEVGDQLQSVLTPGSKVFWDVKSDMYLLYLHEININLPQINNKYTLFNVPDSSSDELLRFGFWNYEIGEQWIQDSDYVVVEPAHLTDVWGWEDRVDKGEFKIIFETSPSEKCRANETSLLILTPVE